MSRYIDADELEETMLYGMCGTGYQTLALSLIKEVPTADVVEVVRCKDCSNADYAGCPKGRCYCMEHGTYFNSDDYCSYGEHEDGGENE